MYRSITLLIFLIFLFKYLGLLLRSMEEIIMHAMTNVLYMGHKDMSEKIINGKNN